MAQYVFNLFSHDRAPKNVGIVIARVTDTGALDTAADSRLRDLAQHVNMRWLGDGQWNYEGDEEVGHLVTRLSNIPDLSYDFTLLPTVQS